MKIKSLHIFSLLLLLCASVGEAQTNEPAADERYLSLVEQADKACADGKWADAAMLLRQAMAEFPTNPGNLLLMNNLGMVQYNMGEDQQALITLTDAIVQAPASVTLLLNRAKILTANEKDTEALDDYNRVIKLDSTNTAARLNHGLISLRNKKFRDARTDFEYLDTHYPAAEDTQVGMATYLSTVGQYEKAIPYYTRLIEDFKLTDFHGARAYCNIMTERLSEAAEDLATAIALNPADGELYLYRAALNKMRFRPEDAKADALKAVELGISPARVKQFVK